MKAFHELVKLGVGDHERKALAEMQENSQAAPVLVLSIKVHGYLSWMRVACHRYLVGKNDSNFCLFIQSLYSSVAERQSCKLKVLGSIPSGGCFPLWVGKR